MEINQGKSRSNNQIGWRGKSPFIHLSLHSMQQLELISSKEKNLVIEFDKCCFLLGIEEY